MQKNFEITVDTIKSVRNQALVVNTNDLKSLKFSITIKQKDAPINLTGATVRIAVKKPDKKTVFQDCTIKDATNGKCEVVLTTQAYIVPGLHAVEVMVYYAADTVAVTGRFSYTSTKGLLDDESIASTNEFQALNKAITDVENIVVDLRENGTGIDAQARQDLEKVTSDLAQKANEDEVRKRTVPITELDISDELKQQINGNAPILQTIGDSVVTPKKTTFFREGKNLFNKDAATLGYYVNFQGVLAANAVYATSEFIQITPDTTYTRTYDNYMAFYDANKNFVSFMNTGAGNKTFVTPSNASFLRTSMRTSELGLFQLEIGDVATPYEPYDFSIDIGNLPSNHPWIDKSMLKDESVDEFKLSIMERSKNLFDKDRLVVGSINMYGTILSHDILYRTTNYFIEIKPNTYYIGKNLHRVLFFTDKKVAIPESFLGGNTAILSPNNAKYARATVQDTYVNTFQFEEGEQSTDYVAYTPKLKSKFIDYSVESNSLLEDIKGTTQKVTFNENLKVSKIEHINNEQVVVRKDEFSYTDTTIRETRTLNTGGTITYVYHLDTLQTEVL